MSHLLLLGLFFVMAKRYDQHPQRTISVTKGWNLGSDVGVGREAEFQLGTKSVKDIRRGERVMKKGSNWRSKILYK
jgi:hypothetical protein